MHCEMRVPRANPYKTSEGFVDGLLKTKIINFNYSIHPYSKMVKKKMSALDPGIHTSNFLFH